MFGGAEESTGGNFLGRGGGGGEEEQIFQWWEKPCAWEAKPFLFSRILLEIYY